MIFIDQEQKEGEEKRSAACFSAGFLLLSSSLTGEYLMTRTHCDSVLESEGKMAALNVRLWTLLLNV